MKIDLRLIHKPEEQSRTRRTLWGVVTGIFWLIYAYLWLPLVTLVLWVLGVRTAAFELYMREHAVEPFLLIALPLIAILATVVMGSWAEYNRAKFGGTNRRQRPDNIPTDVVARVLGANEVVAAAMATAKIIVLHMDDYARPVSASVRTVPETAPALATMPKASQGGEGENRRRRRANPVSVD